MIFLRSILEKYPEGVLTEITRGANARKPHTLAAYIVYVEVEHQRQMEVELGL